MSNIVSLTKYRLLEDYLKEKDNNLFEVVYFIGGIKNDGLIKVSLIIFILTNFYINVNEKTIFKQAISLIVKSIVKNLIIFDNSI